MFIQVIQGTIVDADLLRRQTERWVRELEPGAPGFLGSTGGQVNRRLNGGIGFGAAAGATAGATPNAAGSLGCAA